LAIPHLGHSDATGLERALARTVSLARRLSCVLFPALGGITPLLAASAPHGIAPLAGLAGLVAGWSLVGLGGWHRRLSSPPVLIFALLIVLAAASAAWAVEPVASFARVPRLVVIVIVGGLVIAAARDLDEATRRRVMIALTAGLFLALLPPLVDREFGIGFGPAGLSKHNRGLNVAMLVIWPASLLLAKCCAWRTFAVLWLVAAVTIFSLDSESAKLALMTGVLAAAFGWRAPRLAPVCLAVLTAIYITAAPLVHQKDALPFVPDAAIDQTASKILWLPFSARHRLLIWEFAAARIAEKPWLGWGFDSARSLPGGKFVISGGARLMPLHPHNAVLQLWLELGAGGAALAVALIIWAAIRLRRIADRTASTAAAGYVAAAISMLCVSYGVWQSWWMAALFLSASLLAAALPRDG